MDIKTEIELAKLELKAKQNKFHNAVEDDEISATVHELKAAEIRLNSLLKKAKGMK